MDCLEDTCSFAGNCYSEGLEICQDEYDFASCWKCDGGRLEYTPRFLSPNYPPERL